MRVLHGEDGVWMSVQRADICASTRVCVCVCVCVCVFPCQGRSAVLALDSTCCYWTHWAQLAPQCVSVCLCKWLCVFLCVCERPRERAREGERDIVSLCVGAFMCRNRLHLSVSVSLCVGFILFCISVSSHWQLYSAAIVLLAHRHKHAHTEAIIRSQRPPSPLPRAPGGPSFITNNINSLHSSWDAHTLPPKKTHNKSHRNTSGGAVREFVFTLKAKTILISPGH